MPGTVNGIGTHYYGKKNYATRTAACRACRRVGELASYDTRLWVVFAFIPLIPLGRKRIIDDCPACRRHFAANADAYEQAMQLQTSGALEQYRRQPSPDTALAAHGQFLAFHQHDQAAELRAAALKTFAGHAGLRVGLAEQLRQASSFEEAERLFADAYELDPNDPGARAGVALRRMNQGELNAARNLLEFLEEPGAGQHYPLAPLDILSGCYQRAGLHLEALELAGVLLRELPAVGNQYKFRTFVQRSEKALRRPETILPPPQRSLAGLFRGKDSPYAPWQRTVAMGCAAAVLVVVGLALNNEYIRRHRTLHVVNACGAPVQVQVDDGPAVTIQGLGTLPVAEGAHTVRVHGPVEETHDVNLATGYFDRWFRSPAWVLNPGGEAVLREAKHIYAANPPPGTQRLIAGQAFFFGPNYDYLFESVPRSITVSEHSGEVVKMELNWEEGRDTDAFYTLLPTDRGAALEFARRRLKRNPRQTQLLRAYMTDANPEEYPAVQEFLLSGLDARPVSIPWHRTYQIAAERTVPEAELVARYDRYLAAEPADPALLYLRGRIERDQSKQTAYYRKALDADATLAWPWIGLAAQAAARGNWPETAAAVRKAKEHRPEDADLLDELAHIARLGQGEAEALAGEYRTRLEANPGQAMVLIYLADALVAAGKPAEVDAAVAAWEAKLPSEPRIRVGPQMHAMTLYQEGKAEQCEALCAQTPGLRNTAIHAQALLARGKAKQAADDPAFAKVWEDPWAALALSVAFRLGGQADDAARWWDRARAKMNEYGVAEVMGAANPPTLEAVSGVHLTIQDRALLLAALAGRFPAKQKEYLALAAALNQHRISPYLVVRQAVDGKSGPRP
jgi:tetratricopeptide (TPR) repeat protein